MNIEFFGLSKPPFSAQARGVGVFTGPQQAKLASGLKKALAERDAVVALTGPVGTGKTVSLLRALDSFSAEKSIVRLDRMPLSRSEVLEAMLLEFGLDVEGKSTPQRFAAFRRLLKEHDAEDKRIIIVVEDASRLGVDALAELESLTSADSGASANLIILGPPEFDAELKSPELARLCQRIRFRQTLLPFSAAEVRGYLVHRIRDAGGDCDTIFNADAIGALHNCSGGIARVINGLCNSALLNAVDQQASAVPAQQIVRLARDEFGYHNSDADAAAQTGPTVVAESAVDNVADNKAPQNVVSDNEPAGADIAAAGESVLEESKPEEAALTIPDDVDIPDLIQDTMPRIKALQDPNAEPTPAEALQALRDKTNLTQPSLPILDTGMQAVLEETHSPEIEDNNALQEPRAPERLTHESADTQTTRALDSALRPDTQLLEALDVNVPVLRDASQSAADSSAPADGVPTLSDSMRLDTRSAGLLRTPSIDALSDALEDAREHPAKVGETGPQPALILKTAEPETTAEPVAPIKLQASPEADSMPAITLDDDIRQQQEEARARLAAEAEKAAAALAKIEKPPTEAELAKAREIEAEKKRLAGMASISAQFDSGDELKLEDTQSSLQRTTSAPAPAAAQEKAPDSDIPAVVLQTSETKKPSRLEKLAAELGQATSLEEIDDVAAETLFGEEFSQIAATIAEMAANDKEATDDASVEQALPEVAAQAVGAGRPLVSQLAVPEGPESAGQATALSPGTDQPAKAAQAAQVQATPVAPAPSANKPVAPPGPMDASAAKRLEMVRSLNKAKPVPAFNAMHNEEIILGEIDNSPTHSGPAPERIENQFGTSMTANLKALSAQSIEAMQKAEQQTEATEKKGGLLSRFRRS